VISRRAFVGGSAALTVGAAASASNAQPPPKAYRLGILSPGPAAGTTFAELLKQHLRDLGYTEGRNLIVEWRDADGKPERFDTLAADLVRLNVDAILASVPGATFAAKRATVSIPIVMMNTPDPVHLRLVASLSRPGGNITGTTTLSADLCVKQLELLKTAVPSAQRIAVLWNPTNPWHPIAVKGIEQGAPSLSVRLDLLQVAGPGDFDGAFGRIAAQQDHALLVLADPMTFFHRVRLAELSSNRRIPSMFGLREHVQVGGLMSYWAHGPELYRRVAMYLDRIFKGAKPGDLPIEQASRFDLVINLRTARLLNVRIPESLLLRADEVIR